MTPPTDSAHRILRLFVRPARRETPEERDALTLVAGRGVEGDHGAGGRRPITILFAGDWSAALTDLGDEVDPIARRANVLVSGAGAGSFVGRTIRLGEAEIEVKGVVAPCARMDEARDGLRAALEPDSRGGVWGEILRGGVITPGDSLA